MMACIKTLGRIVVFKFYYVMVHMITLLFVSDNDILVLVLVLMVAQVCLRYNLTYFAIRAIQKCKVVCLFCYCQGRYQAIIPKAC